MRIVTRSVEVIPDKCIGCKTCERVCITYAIKVINKNVKVNPELCTGCENCEQRCPEYALKMVDRAQPITLYTDPRTVDQKKIKELCKKARFNPEQIVCYCTTTRAEEVAAAILKGADTPDKVTLATGVRTGCKVECIQPILRLLNAAEIKPPKAEGYQWYGLTPTAWDIPKEVKDKYSTRGFYFDDDIKLLDTVIHGKKLKKGNDNYK